MTLFGGDTSTLRALPLLSSLDDAEMAALLARAQRRSYPPRASILRAGDRAEGLYLILSGTVNLVLEDGHGREMILAVLRSPEFFGENGLFNARPELAHAQSHGACDILYIPRHIVFGWLDHNRRVRLLILETLAGRLAEAQREIANLAFVDVYGRVARVLLQRGREANGLWWVEPGVEQIAAMVGASREMVSRVVKDMLGKGALARQKRKLIVLDRASLVRRTLRGRERACHGLTDPMRA